MEEMNGSDGIARIQSLAMMSWVSIDWKTEGNYETSLFAGLQLTVFDF